MALIKKKFGNFELGFFLYWVGNEKKLFFATTHGNWTLPHPVCDGKIQDRVENFVIYPTQEVEVIPRDDWSKFNITNEMVIDFLGL